MKKEIYVNKGKNAIAIIKDGMLTEYFEHSSHKYSADTVIKGKVNSVSPSLNAVFVDIDDEKTGYLPINGRKYRNNEEVVVQIRKEKIEDKGVALSDVINIAGEYAVVSKGKSKCGVSSKIKDEIERNRLKKLAYKYAVDGFSIVIRTNSLNESEEIIKEDIDKTYEIFEEMEDNLHNAKKGAILYQIKSKTRHRIKEFCDCSQDTLITDDLDLYNEYFEKYNDHNKIKLYTKEYDMFDYYNITAQINTINYKKIWLKSGGYLLIDYTHALTVIDVNTGKNNKSKDANKTFLQTNIEGAIEAARQIRLRNIGGIIVIDFIDSEQKSMQKEILKYFEEYISEDKLKYTIGGFSRLGLFEIIRQKNGSKNS